jgi:hypothetical protein
MSASVNKCRDEYLIEMIRLLDAFESQSGPDNHVTAVRNSISNLKNSLAFKRTEEVALLVLKNESEACIKELLKQNFPSGIRIGNVEEMLKLVYSGTDVNNLKTAIKVVHIFDCSLQEMAFRALYEDIKFKKHTTEPEMLLLQKKINQLEQPGSVLKDTKEQVDDDCGKILSRIVRGIEERDYSISIYIAKELESAILDENMGKIVEEFCSGTLMENTLLLFEYSINLPYISNWCFLIDTLLKELEKRQLLASEKALHLLALAKYTKEQLSWPNVAESFQILCNEAIEKLSLNKEKLFRHFQKYIENSDDMKINDLHLSHQYMSSIVRDFVSFYYNGEVSRTKYLLSAAKAIFQYIPVGRILSQLHEEMVKSDRKYSFEAFRLFNEVNRYMSYTTFNSLQPKYKEPFEELKETSPACMRQLLWPEKGTAEYQVVNKFFNAALGVQEDNKSVYCFSLGDKRCNQTWKITVDEETSLLTLTHKQNELELGAGKESSPSLVQTGEAGWMAKAVDENHLKIYHTSQGEKLIFNHLVNTFLWMKTLFFHVIENKKLLWGLAS